MEIVTEKFVKKPLYVDAVQVTEENFLDIAEWCQGKLVSVNGGLEVSVVDAKAGTPEVNPAAFYIHVRVHNPQSARQTKAFVGDWLLYTDRGYKVYSPKAFEGSFDPAEANGKVTAVTKQV